MLERARRGAGVARVFAGQPERLAAAWRRVRFAEARKDGGAPRNQLDSVVEPFIREVGRKLEGKEGSPWSRTRAVLRLMYPDRRWYTVTDQQGVLTIEPETP